MGKALRQFVKQQDERLVQLAIELTTTTATTTATAHPSGGYHGNTRDSRTTREMLDTRDDDDDDDHGSLDGNVSDEEEGRENNRMTDFENEPHD